MNMDLLRINIPATPLPTDLNGYRCLIFMLKCLLKFSICWLRCFAVKVWMDIFKTSYYMYHIMPEWRGHIYTDKLTPPLCRGKYAKKGVK